MVITAAAKICPNCGIDLPDKVPDYCPECQIQLKDPETNKLSLPKYLSIQMTEKIEHSHVQVKNQLEKEMKKDGAEYKEELEKLSAKYTNDLISEYAHLIRHSKATDKLGCAEDTYEMLKWLPFSGMSGTERLKFVTLCKLIGDLAGHEDGRIRAGGMSYDGITTTTVGDGARSESKASRTRYPSR